jgi:hypothetical protein
MVGQSTKPAAVLQLSVHTPAWQRCPGAQTFPQAPQFWLSCCSLAQYAAAPVPQAFGSAVGQAHAPWMQFSPPGQTMPQPPQLFTSVCSAAQ